MKRGTTSKRFLLPILTLGGCLLMAPAGAEAAAARRTVSLDGTWQLAEGATDQKPTRFDRKAPVPGLVDQAVPAFDPQCFADRKKQIAPISGAAWTNRAFWYRREFKVEGPVPAVANLLVRKAAYGCDRIPRGALIDRLHKFMTNSKTNLST